MDDKLKNNKQEYNRIMEENKKIINKFDKTTLKTLDEFKFINTVLASLFGKEDVFETFNYIFDYAIRHKIKLNSQEKYQDYIIHMKCEKFENKG